MANLLKPLGLAALLALAGPALAQEATPEAPAEDVPGLDLGSDAAAEGDEIEIYVDETFDDWERECLRVPDGADVCRIAQVLRENPEASPVGKITVGRLPAGREAVASSEIVLPLGVVLPEGLSIAIDSAAAKKYGFYYCLQVGCAARVGFTAGDLQALKAGESATLTIVAATPITQPDVPIEIKMSLKGFTAAFDSLPVPVAAQ